MPLVSPRPELVAQIERGEWFRAAGACTCPVCNKTYYEHPSIVGYEWLVLLCNGQVVKL